MVRGAWPARDLRRRQKGDAAERGTTRRLREEIVTNEVQHDLDRLGIAKTAREEKTRAREVKLAASQAEQAERSANERGANERGAKKNDAAYDARMAQLYREVVLKEKPATSDEAGFIPLGAIAPANGNGHGVESRASSPAIPTAMACTALNPPSRPS